VPARRSELLGVSDHVAPAGPVGAVSMDRPKRITGLRPCPVYELPLKSNGVSFIAQAAHSMYRAARRITPLLRDKSRRTPILPGQEMLGRRNNLSQLFDANPRVKLGQVGVVRILWQPFYGTQSQAVGVLTL
jgi:hypothetical protein